MSPDLIHVPTFSRLTDWCGAWAIDESHGMSLLAKIQKTDLIAHVGNAPERKADTSYSVAKVGKENIAVVMLTGVLMKSVPSMESGTSTIEARKAIRKAAADPDVSAILLAIESPGGTVSGTFDLAADIKAAAKSKPVWAQIEDLGASAAYAAASQADRIFANNSTAEVGSIGTVMVVYDQSVQAEKVGIKTLVFKTGPLKGAGVPGSTVTDDQQQYFQSRIDEAQKSFDAAVQKGRSLTDKQLEAVKTGGVFGAEEAMSKKLIDGIQSMETTLNQLAAEARRRGRDSSARAVAEIQQPFQRGNNVDDLNQNAAGIDATASITKMREMAAAEVERQAGITAKAGKYPDVAAKAIREGWSVDQAELAALRKDMETGKSVSPNVITGAGKWSGFSATVGDNANINTVLEAAITKSIGSPGREKAFSANVLQAADDNFRSMGLQEILMTAAIANGYEGSPGRRISDGNLRPVLKAAFSERMAGVSTVSLPGILKDVVNREILGGYTEEDMTWQEVAAIKPVNNFQTVTSYRLLDSMEYEKIGPDGKMKHGTVSEESYTRQADTYAKMFALTRRDIINDDLGAFADIRTRLGRGSAKKFNNVFWTEFLSDASTFWTTARTNYITGATTNLGADGVGLGLGIKAFRTMTSPSTDGAKRVGGRPDRIIVPPELESIARTLYIASNASAVKASDVNIYANLYRPVVVPWLSDSTFTGYSTTAWYLLRPPTDMACIVASFLNGNQSPTVESADADFDTLGIQFRGYHDFGVDQAEYLAGIKSKGAA